MKPKFSEEVKELHEKKQQKSGPPSLVVQAAVV